MMTELQKIQATIILSTWSHEALLAFKEDNDSEDMEEIIDLVISMQVQEVHYGGQGKVTAKDSHQAVTE